MGSRLHYSPINAYMRHHTHGIHVTSTWAVGPHGMLSLLSLTRGPHAQAHDASAAWDLGSMAATLTDWGLSLQDGVTVIADNISDFVADLASAFDAGWEGEEEQRPGATG